MLTGFEYHRPAHERELGGMLVDLDGVTLLAGGTDVLVQMRSGRLRPRHLVDLTHMNGLLQIEVTADGGLHIGATAGVCDVTEHPYVAKHFPALVEGGREVGSVQIQNRATIAGNICNASPAADTVPALLAFDASVLVAGLANRVVPLRDFFVGPGKCDLQGGEWVREIEIPPPRTSGSCYLKLGRTRGVDLALVGVACRVSAASASMSFASVAPTPLHIDLTGIQDPAATELGDDSIQAIRSMLHPIDDVRASAMYREQMAIVLAGRAWRLAQRRLLDAERET